jgi:heme exporter protein C
MAGNARIAWWILTAATTASMIVALWSIFFVAPEELVMGPVQKIFYFHVPAAMMCYLAVFVMLAGSIAYLWQARRGWDQLALAATETGLLFCTVVLISGPIWAKPAWGTWWTWEARLTTTLILWILLLAALMVRRYADSRELGARLASVLGILAGVDIFIIRKAVEWWRGQHPQVFKPGSEQALAPGMGQAFGLSVLAFLLLFILLTGLRYRVARLEDRVADR